MADIENKLKQVHDENEAIQKLESELSKIKETITEIEEKIRLLDLYVDDLEDVDRTMTEIREEVTTITENVHTITTTTKDSFKKKNYTIPDSVTKIISSLELLSESTTTILENKEREYKRARATRLDYNDACDVVVAWLQKAQEQLQDKSNLPEAALESINVLLSEVAPIKLKLDSVRRNGLLIAESTNNASEKEIIHRTISSLEDQMSKVESWLYEREVQLKEAVNALQQFMEYHTFVQNWIQKVELYLARDAEILSLQDAKQKLADLLAFAKESTQVQQNIKNMSKRLERIGEVCSAGDLSDTLDNLEQDESSADSSLQEQLSLLQEMVEEWEQCERKIKEVATWVEKTKANLDSPNFKKRSLRDQLTAREKMMSDMSVQKTKVLMALEKLQVHLRTQSSGQHQILTRGQSVQEELEMLHSQVEEQCETLQVCVSQEDQYLQDTQSLKHAISQADHQLKLATSPSVNEEEKGKLTELQQDEPSDVNKNVASTDRISVVHAPEEPFTETLLTSIKQSANEASENVQSNICLDDMGTGSLQTEQRSFKTVTSNSQLVFSSSTVTSSDHVAAKVTSSTTVSRSAQQKSQISKSISVTGKSSVEKQFNVDKTVFSGEMEQSVKSVQSIKSSHSKTLVDSSQTISISGSEIKPVNISENFSVTQDDSLASDFQENETPIVKTIIGKANVSTSSVRSQVKQTRMITETRVVSKGHTQIIKEVLEPGSSISEKSIEGFGKIGELEVNKSPSKEWKPSVLQPELIFESSDYASCKPSVSDTSSELLSQSSFVSESDKSDVLNVGKGKSSSKVVHSEVSQKSTTLKQVDLNSSATSIKVSHKVAIKNEIGLPSEIATKDLENTETEIVEDESTKTGKTKRKSKKIVSVSSAKNISQKKTVQISTSNTATVFVNESASDVKVLPTKKIQNLSEKNQNISIVRTSDSNTKKMQVNQESVKAEANSQPTTEVLSVSEKATYQDSSNSSEIAMKHGKMERKPEEQPVSKISGDRTGNLETVSFGYDNSGKVGSRVQLFTPSLQTTSLDSESSSQTESSTFYAEDMKGFSSFEAVESQDDDGEEAILPTTLETSSTPISKKKHNKKGKKKPSVKNQSLGDVGKSGISLAEKQSVNVKNKTSFAISQTKLTKSSITVSPYNKQYDSISHSNKTQDSNIGDSKSEFDTESKLLGTDQREFATDIPFSLAEKYKGKYSDTFQKTITCGDISEGENQLVIGIDAVPIDDESPYMCLGKRQVLAEVSMSAQIISNTISKRETKASDELKPVLDPIRVNVPCVDDDKEVVDLTLVTETNFSNQFCSGIIVEGPDSQKTFDPTALPQSNNNQDDQSIDLTPLESEKHETNASSLNIQLVEETKLITNKKKRNIIKIKEQSLSSLSSEQCDISAGKDSKLFVVENIADDSYSQTALEDTKNPLDVERSEVTEAKEIVTEYTLTKNQDDENGNLPIESKQSVSCLDDPSTLKKAEDFSISSLDVHVSTNADKTTILSKDPKVVIPEENLSSAPQQDGNKSKKYKKKKKQKSKLDDIDPGLSYLTENNTIKQLAPSEITSSAFEPLSTAECPEDLSIVADDSLLNKFPGCISESKTQEYIEKITTDQSYLHENIENLKPGTHLPLDIDLEMPSESSTINLQNLSLHSEHVNAEYTNPCTEPFSGIEKDRSEEKFVALKSDIIESEVQTNIQMQMIEENLNSSDMNTNAQSSQNASFVEDNIVTDKNDKFLSTQNGQSVATDICNSEASQSHADFFTTKNLVTEALSEIVKEASGSPMVIENNEQLQGVDYFLQPVESLPGAFVPDKNEEKVNTELITSPNSNQSEHPVNYDFIKDKTPTTSTKKETEVPKFSDETDSKSRGKSKKKKSKQDSYDLNKEILSQETEKQHEDCPEKIISATISTQSVETEILSSTILSSEKGGMEDTLQESLISNPDLKSETSDLSQPNDVTSKKKSKKKKAQTKSKIALYEDIKHHSAVTDEKPTADQTTTIPFMSSLDESTESDVLPLSTESIGASFESNALLTTESSMEENTESDAMPLTTASFDETAGSDVVLTTGSSVEVSTKSEDVASSELPTEVSSRTQYESELYTKDNEIDIPNKLSEEIATVNSSTKISKRKGKLKRQTVLNVKEMKHDKAPLQLKSDYSTVTSTVKSHISETELQDDEFNTLQSSVQKFTETVTTSTLQTTKKSTKTEVTFTSLQHIEQPDSAKTSQVISSTTSSAEESNCSKSRLPDEDSKLSKIFMSSTLLPTEETWKSEDLSTIQKSVEDMPATPVHPSVPSVVEYDETGGQDSNRQFVSSEIAEEMDSSNKVTIISSKHIEEQHNAADTSQMKFPSLSFVEESSIGESALPKEDSKLSETTISATSLSTKETSKTKDSSETLEQLKEIHTSVDFPSNESELKTEDAQWEKSKKKDNLKWQSDLDTKEEKLDDMPVTLNTEMSATQSTLESSSVKKLVKTVTSSILLSTENFTETEVTLSPTKHISKQHDVGDTSQIKSKSSSISAVEEPSLNHSVLPDKDSKFSEATIPSTLLSTEETSKIEYSSNTLEQLKETSPDFPVNESELKTEDGKGAKKKSRKKGKQKPDTKLSDKSFDIGISDKKSFAEVEDGLKNASTKKDVEENLVQQNIEEKISEHASHQDSRFDTMDNQSSGIVNNNLNRPVINEYSTQDQKSGSLLQTEVIDNSPMEEKENKLETSISQINLASDSKARQVENLLKGEEVPCTSEVQERKVSMESASELLLEKNKEMKGLLTEELKVLSLQTQEYDVASEENVLEQVLLSIQKKLFSSNPDEVPSDPVIDLQSSSPASEFVVSTWFLKEVHPLENSISDIDESNLEDACLPTSLPRNIPCFDESEKSFYIQKVDSLLAELENTSSSGDNESGQNSDKITIHYVLIMEFLKKWIEFTETWILQTSQLSAIEFNNENQSIETQLNNLQHYVSVMVSKVPETLTPEVSECILNSLSELQKQLDTTRQLSNTSFAKVEFWSQKSSDIELEHENLTSQLLSHEEKLIAMQGGEKCNFSDAESVSSGILQCTTECELLCLYKQRLSLTWLARKPKEYETSLNWYKNLRLKGLTNYECAVKNKILIEDYETSAQFLKQLTNVLENVTAAPLNIKDQEDLKKKIDIVMTMMQELLTLSWVVIKNHQMSAKFLSYSSEKDFDLLITQAFDTLDKGKYKLEEWNNLERKIIEQAELSKLSCLWCQRKSQAVQSMEEDIEFIQNLKVEMLGQSSDIESIEAKSRDILSKVECLSTRESTSQALADFQNLQGLIESKVEFGTLFNQWKEMEEDVKDLQRWLSSANAQMNNMKTKIKNNKMNSSFLLTCLKDVVKLDADYKCRSVIFKFYEDLCMKEKTNKIKGVPKLSKIREKWIALNDLIESNKKCLLLKSSDCDANELMEELQLWKKDSENNDALSYQVEAVSELKDVRFNICYSVKALNVISQIYQQEFSSSKAEEEDSKDVDLVGSMSVETLHLSEMKYQCELDKFETLNLQFIEFERVLNEVFGSMNAMQYNLREINLKITQKSLPEILKCNFLIEELQRKLASNTLIITLNNLGRDICDAPASKNLKNKFIKKQELVDSKLLDIRSLMSETDEKIKKFLQLWKEYEDASDNLQLFVSERKRLVSIFCGNVPNDECLNYSVTVFEELSQDLKDKKGMMELVNAISSKLKETTNKDCHIIIDEKLNILTLQWLELVKSVEQLLAEHASLKAVFSDYFQSHHALTEWISKNQVEVLCLQSFRLQTLEQVVVMTEESNSYEKILLSLLTKYDAIDKSSLLNSATKETLRNQLNHLNMAFKSIRIQIESYKNNLAENRKEFMTHRQALQTAENFAIEMEKQINTDVPNSKKEIENAIESIEELLGQITSHSATVQHIKRKLILSDIVEFEYANKVSKVDQALQNGTPRLTSCYLKLFKAYSENNSIPENVDHIVKFIEMHPKLLDSMPSSHSDLWLFYMKCQVTSIYMQGYRFLLQHIIKEGMQKCKVVDPSNSESFIRTAMAVQREWEALEGRHKNKLNSARRQLLLWEKYLYQLNKVQIWISKIENELSGQARGLKPSEIKNKMNDVQELIDGHQNVLLTMEVVKTFADDLCTKLDSAAKLSISEEIVTLQSKIDQQINILMPRLGKLIGLLKFVENFGATSENITSSLQLSIESHNTDSNVFGNVSARHREIQVELQKLDETLARLDQLHEDLVRVSEDLICPNYYTAISVQKQIAWFLHKHWSWKIICLSEDLNRNSFKNLLSTISIWSSSMSEKIKKPYFEPPETILHILENPIKKDMKELESLLEKISIMNQMMEDVEASEKISKLQSTFSSLSSLQNSREHNLIRILTQKERVDMLRGKLMKMLLNNENRLTQVSVEFSNVSITEIDATIQEVETVKTDRDGQVENLTILDSTTKELVKEPDAFSYTSEQQLFNGLTQSILHFFEMINALSKEKHSRLRDIKENWQNILSLLNDLEKWLEAREKIASDVDYNSPELSRIIYLEGIKTFESLKHNFQDNIQVLHSVNSTYHKISRRDLDVKSCLQTRVLSANERWHILYKRVTDTISTISNVLQLWDDYEQLQQHLHLFLTETDIKVTSLKNSGEFSREDWNYLMNEFGHHKVVLERFYSMANNLKERSICSSKEIDAQVEEITNYWMAVYESLQKYQETHSKAMAEEETHRSEANVNVTGRDYIEAVSDVKSLSKEGFETILDAIDSMENVSETAISHDSLTEDQITEFVEDAQEEFFKDLLAALKEAEERIDFLENVLSEQTPTGIEEDSGPNYCRLLAACRSSIDVIQHLNHLLSQNVFHQQKSKYDEADIQSRTEGMLNRWERLENATLNKEHRAQENTRKWQKFSEELKSIEVWLLQTLQTQSSLSTVDADIEKFTMLLQKHEALVKEINKQKDCILTLNAASRNIPSSNSGAVFSIKDKLQSVNEHWDKLCALVMKWQNELQKDFLQSCELHNTLSEMELWLAESEEIIKSVDLREESSTTLLHEQHTEIFALKQQLDNCAHRVKSLLDMSVLLFYDLGNSEASFSASSEGVGKMQSKLSEILDLCRTLLLEATEKLDVLTKLLMGEKILEESSANLGSSDSQEEGGPTRIRKCCNFLVRVARASFPIQAVLLLLLGAAILIPKDEEEIGCRFSNNFASSINLRYPDGPPPV